jgi:hypothetical protein
MQTFVVLILFHLTVLTMSMPALARFRQGVGIFRQRFGVGAFVCRPNLCGLFCCKQRALL